jgi:hypothetical protein
MIISISAKCSDLFVLQDEKGREYQGYVPDFFPGQHWGDYVILNIDTQTGQILNWNPVSNEEIEELFPEQDGEDFYE